MDADTLEKLSRFARGRPVDEQAVERYRDVDAETAAATLKLCRSKNPRRRKTGMLRAAAIVAANPQPDEG